MNDHTSDATARLRALADYLESVEVMLQSSAPYSADLRALLAETATLRAERDAALDQLFDSQSAGIEMGNANATLRAQLAQAQDALAHIHQICVMGIEGRDALEERDEVERIAKAALTALTRTGGVS